MRIILIAGLLVSVTSFGFTRKHVSIPDGPEPSPSPFVSPGATPSPIASASPVGPVATPVLSSSPARIIVGNIFGATTAEIKMIREGEKLANAMLDKPCFKQWVLAAHYSESNGLSQQQIYDLVTIKPSTIDVEMYTGSWRANHISKTVGYENDPFDGVVHMNRYFVQSAYMVADNLIHEDRGHSLDFHHYGVHSTSEPYGMNYAYEGCSQQQMQARGAKAFKPPGIKIEIRHKVKK
jgi:hypothetical protein